MNEKTKCSNCGLEGYRYIDMDGNTHHIETLNDFEKCPECGTKFMHKVGEEK